MTTNGIFMLYIILSTFGIIAMTTSAGQIRIPAEWEDHNRTFMVWPASEDIWGKKFLTGVRNDIANIAKAIGKYEPVTIIVDPSQLEGAQAAIEGFNGVDFLLIPVNDLWARDTLPIFGLEYTTTSTNSKENVLTSVDLNFNGWGKKQEHAKDSKVAQAVAQKLKISRVQADIVGEGGALEMDGEGTLLVTESSLVNENRNPGQSRNEIELELKIRLGVTKVIWFDGVYDQDITDAHIDSLVRFVRPGVVILNRPQKGTPPGFDVWSNSSDHAKQVLEKETDAKGRKLKIIEMHEPDEDKIITIGSAKSFLSSYVNFFIANGAVIFPKFGDYESDNEAQEILRLNFPGRDIVPVQITYLASGGGGIHCATHDVPSTVLHGDDQTCSSGSTRNIPLLPKLF